MDVRDRDGTYDGKSRGRPVAAKDHPHQPQPQQAGEDGQQRDEDKQSWGHGSRSSEAAASPGRERRSLATVMARDDGAAQHKNFIMAGRRAPAGHNGGIIDRGAALVNVGRMWWVSSEPREGSRVRKALRYAAVLPIVALVTAIAEVTYRLTGSDRLSSIFIAGVLLAAFLLGSGPAYLAAGLAFGVYFFLVDPRFQFTFGSPDDFNVLMMFLAVSALVGLLTGRVRDEAARAKARQGVNAALLDATQTFSASSDVGHICERLAHHLAIAARGQAVVADGARVFVAPNDLDDAEVTPRMPPFDPAVAGRKTHHIGGWSFRSLSANEATFGLAAWRPAEGALSAEEETLLAVLVDTGAAAITRAQLAAGKAEAEARARTEDLRNALLSSISHDLRTPLAAILASATSLQEFSAAFDGETRKDLLATIREESERLDNVVANLLNMSRLESGALTIRSAAFNVPDVVRRVVDRRQRSEERVLSLVVDPRTPEAGGDPVLFEQALGNVVDNALRYSPGKAPIGLVVRAEQHAVVVEVWDEGPGVPEPERERIFEKFYRSSAAPQVPGTGLGLAITRGLLSAMGGTASVRNRSDGVGGLVVDLRLPEAAA